MWAIRRHVETALSFFETYLQHRFCLLEESGMTVWLNVIILLAAARLPRCLVADWLRVNVVNH